MAQKKSRQHDVPFLMDVNWRDPEKERPQRFPFHLPWLKEFSLEFRCPVTFFVGENGSGKSTLMEALAVMTGMPITGGGFNESATKLGPETDSELGRALRPAYRKQPRDGYFFRAELFANFATLLDEREADPEFKEDPYTRYGGKSLHHRSHGESFLELMTNRLNRGLFLLDEPESALSPQRQLGLLAKIADRVKTGNSQFIIATHSPILLTYPEAEILSFDEDSLQRVAIEDTSHYQITKGILEHPDRYWQHLRENGQQQLFE